MSPSDRLEASGADRLEQDLGGVRMDSDGFNVSFDEVPSAITDIPGWRPTAAVKAPHARWAASERNPSDAVSRGRHGWFIGHRELRGPLPRPVGAVTVAGMAGPSGAAAARGSRAPRPMAAAAQRRRLARHAIAERPILTRLTMLETLALRSNTERSYHHPLRTFVDWCPQHHQDWSALEELDAVLAQYFSDQYRMRTACNIGSQTLAAIAHVTPSTFKKTAAIPPRASRASAAWKRRASGKTRLPLPRAAVHAVAGWLISHGQLGLACWIAIALAAYVGPAETQYSTRENLSELRPALTVLRQASAPGVSLWAFSLEDITAQFWIACRALSPGALRPHLHRLRHGGASDDLLTGRRSPVEAQRRGRWADPSSMRHSGKEGALLGKIARTNAAFFTFGARVEANLATLLERGLDGAGPSARAPAPALRAPHPAPPAAGKRALRRPPARR
ncbi:unnamed protein product [Prorocentrum cordatum]|uniref:Core-binding (CB) domain-containing protein n=1 Tax=Prorocentrum cordatum TaxID=2364126 RepID=A0ABN9T295_9DINO|nr:unnamed protein product [Polarella glacialis]